MPTGRVNLTDGAAQPDPGEQIERPDAAGTSHAAPRISGEPPLTLAAALAEVRESPAFLTAVSKIAATVSHCIGRPVSADTFAKAAQDRRGVTERFAVTVRDLIQGFAAAPPAAQARGAETDHSGDRLPQHIRWPESLADDEDARKDASRAPRQLCGDLYQYTVPADLSSEETGTRSAFGEILDRLAINPSRAQQDRFRVTFQGDAYSDFDAFIDALLRSGHRVDLDVSNEVSDFLHLMVRQPDGAFREVQTAIRIRTGYFTVEGTEIIVPAVHSHLIFRISGPEVNTAVEFYQGIQGTHFYPSRLTWGQSWVGIRTSATYGGPAAVQALKASGLYLDLLTRVSREDALFAEGYGQSGICSDTVALMEILIGQEPSVYPLLINKQLVLKHVPRLIAQRPHLAERYLEIRDAIERMPSDGELEASQPQRILNSIPYEPGETPHAGFNEFRRTFGENDPGEFEGIS